MICNYTILTDVSRLINIYSCNSKNAPHRLNASSKGVSSSSDRNLIPRFHKIWNFWTNFLTLPLHILCRGMDIKSYIFQGFAMFSPRTKKQLPLHILCRGMDIKSYIFTGFEMFSPRPKKQWYTCIYCSSVVYFSRFI